MLLWVSSAKQYWNLHRRDMAGSHLKTLPFWANSAGDKLMIFLANRILHFMQIVSTEIIRNNYLYHADLLLS